MSNVNTTTNENTQVATIMPDIFGDIDFSTLNTVITKLGNSSKELSDGEKEFAVEAIGTWETSVIEKLHDKQKEAESWLVVFDVNSYSFTNYYSTLDESEIEALINAVGLQDLYNSYLDKIEEIKAMVRPEIPVVDLTTTVEEQLNQKRDYELACQIHDIKVSKLQRETTVLMKQIKKELNNKDEVKELIARLKKYKKNVSKFKRECAEKSQLAKINVSIESEDVRDSLKELLNFSITI